MGGGNDKTTIFAPISGVVTPLEKVPDPTFAQKMVGDGLAIDPTEEILKAPCDGTVTQLHPAKHALTVTETDGTEVLMHIGLNTVTLKGQGFEAKVAEGAKVRRGDELIRFDADYIARNAQSLLTMVVITNEKAVVTPIEGVVAEGALAGLELAEAGKTPLLSVSLPEGAKAGDASEASEAASDPIVILNPDGLHARPSAVLVATAKKFASKITLVKDGKEANAKSVVGIMGLSVKLHDKIVLKARGADARDAVKEVSALILSGLGENLHAMPKAASKAATRAALGEALRDRSKRDERAKPEAPVAQPKPAKPEDAGDPTIMAGVPASPGLATGPVFQLKGFSAEILENGAGADTERKALEEAVASSLKDLKDLVDSTRAAGDAGKAAIFTAHQELLEDPALLEVAEEGVGQGKSAAFAWKKSYEAQAEALASLDNPLLAGRATDVRDVGERVLRILAGSIGERPAIPAGTILVAVDLTPTDTANLQKSGALGFCVTGGGATSHASILARAAGIPAVVAAPERILDIPDGTEAILDGDKGMLKASPSPQELQKAKAVIEKIAAERAREMLEAAQDAVTLDGFKLKVVGNISGIPEAISIPGLGGEGVGLLRSEFLFLERAQAPDESEQTATYEAIARALGPTRDLIVRTLDVGGDKPLAYMPLPPEENPFLGVRGIRLNLLGTDIFRAQVRSILRAAAFTNLGIMFPMVATLEEFRAARDLVLGEKAGLGVTAPVQIGVMVEVPSAAVMADVLAPEVDFFSIGTNDLTQYTLAMDRGHPRLAKMADALHPAVLRLIGRACQAAAESGKWVGVCGGVAGDPVATSVLMGLGVGELSVSPKSIPSIKAGVRRLRIESCREIAKKALKLSTAAEVRAMLAKEEAAASGGEGKSGGEGRS